MSKGNTFEADLLKLIFQGVDIANIADDAASSPITNLYVSLHTADPGEGGNQTTNEISYTPYARIAVARSTGGWAINGSVITPVNHIDFAQMASGSGGTVTHFGIGTASSGAGKLLYKGPVTPNLVIANGDTPRIKNTTEITED